MKIISINIDIIVVRSPLPVLSSLQEHFFHWLHATSININDVTATKRFEVSALQIEGVFRATIGTIEQTSIDEEGIVTWEIEAVVLDEIGFLLF